MTRKITLIAIVLAAVFAAPASASVPAEGPPEFVAQFSAATQWWGQEPTVCSVVVLAERELIPGRGGEALGYPDGHCEIAVQPGEPTCLLPELFEHEVGHLLGYQHSSDPTSVMYPSVSNVGCERVPVEADLASYVAWLAKATARCHRVARPSCREDVKLIRSEVLLRRRRLAALVAPHP